MKRLHWILPIALTVAAMTSPLAVRESRAVIYQENRPSLVFGPGVLGTNGQNVNLCTINWGDRYKETHPRDRRRREHHHGAGLKNRDARAGRGSVCPYTNNNAMPARRTGIPLRLSSSASSLICPGR